MAKLSACRTRNSCWLPPVSEGRFEVADQISRLPIAASASTPMTRTQSACHNADRRSTRGRDARDIASRLIRGPAYRPDSLPGLRWPG